MRYRVRTPDGELEYPSLGAVEQAYVQGLVDPEDELLEEGGTLWRKARSHPALARARPRRAGGAGRSQALAVVAVAALGLVALLLFRRSGGAALLGLILALVVASVLMRVTVKAFRRPPPR